MEHSVNSKPSLSCGQLSATSTINRCTFSPRHQDRFTKGRFKQTKKATTVPGVDSTKRTFLGQNSGPASWPDANRYMEALIVKLCASNPSPVKDRQKVQRWWLIIASYKKIRDTVLGNAKVMSETKIQLAEINNKTLVAWYNNRSKTQEKVRCQQSLLPSLVCLHQWSDRQCHLQCNRTCSWPTYLLQLSHSVFPWQCLQNKNRSSHCYHHSPRQCKFPEAPKATKGKKCRRRELFQQKDISQELLLPNVPSADRNCLPGGTDITKGAGTTQTRKLLDR